MVAGHIRGWEKDASDKVTFYPVSSPSMCPSEDLPSRDTSCVFHLHAHIQQLNEIIRVPN